MAGSVLGREDGQGSETGFIKSKPKPGPHRNNGKTNCCLAGTGWWPCFPLGMGFNKLPAETHRAFSAQLKRSHHGRLSPGAAPLDVLSHPLGLWSGLWPRLCSGLHRGNRLIQRLEGGVLVSPFHMDGQDSPRPPFKPLLLLGCSQHGVRTGKSEAGRCSRGAGCVRALRLLPFVKVENCSKLRSNS